MLLDPHSSIVEACGGDGASHAMATLRFHGVCFIRLAPH